MDAFTRLVECGIDPSCAAESVAWFRRQGDDHGLDAYIKKAESRRHKNHYVCAV